MFSPPRSSSWPPESREFPHHAILTQGLSTLAQTYSSFPPFCYDRLIVRRQGHRSQDRTLVLRSPSQTFPLYPTMN